MEIITKLVIIDERFFFLCRKNVCAAVLTSDTGLTLPAICDVNAQTESMPKNMRCSLLL